jgi:hypothetical protein
MKAILKSVKYAALLGMAMLAPHAAAAVSGAIYTSTFSGITVNENVKYEGKQFVYLNGGPQNTTGSELTPGLYFYQVTTPNNVLLSTDNGYCRMVSVGADGRFAGAFDPINLNPPVTECTTGIHANGATNPANGGGISVQLIPYLDTTNNGGEYKVWLIEAGCPDLSVQGAIINFRSSCSKTDNFKVRFCANGLPADEFGNCQTTELCPDGSPIPPSGVCPTPTCPDGSPLPPDGICPTCPDGSPVPPPPQLCENQRQSLFITVSGQKYLDVNANGMKDGGENPISGVDVNLFVGSDPYTLTTDGSGNWSRTFEFPPDPNSETAYIGYPVSFTACEEPMSGQWLQTGPLVGALSGGFAAVANASRCWTQGELNNDTGEDFGNICWGVAGGGHTKGFWSNKNGAKVINTNSCYSALQAALPMLVKLDGSLLWSTSPSLAVFQKWLTSSNSSNAASQLSAQLAAMWLNVKCNPDGVADGALVYAPDLTVYGIANSGGFASINDIIAAAAASLASNPITVVASAERTKQLLLMTALDRGNNNLNWVGDASSCVTPDDWQIITLPE